MNQENQPEIPEHMIREAEINNAVEIVLDAFCGGKGWDAICEALNALARLKGRNGRAQAALTEKAATEVTASV